ncbi:MAG TPA: PIN domain-containing protein [Gemmatimonadaceae bacterium]|nr:PIN domain-containing protein [Gemmatimonadaceae bacterium]
MTIVADTGALYALVDADDAWHERVLEWWRANREPVVVPVTVLPEVAYLLQTRVSPAAELAFVRACAADEFTLEPLDDDDMARAADIMERYDDLPLGFVDASIVAAAERLAARTVLTTDRRHFAAVRPRHVRGLVLMP